MSISATARSPRRVGADHGVVVAWAGPVAPGHAYDPEGDGRDLQALAKCSCRKKCVQPDFHKLGSPGHRDQRSDQGRRYWDLVTASCRELARAAGERVVRPGESRTSSRAISSRSSYVELCSRTRTGGKEVQRAAIHWASHVGLPISET